MSEPKFTGVWISAAIFQTPSISITAKVVYGVLESLDNEAGCFASNAYLSKHLGLEVRQVQNILADLETAGLITRVEETGRRIIRTIERVAVVKALTNSQVTRSEGCKKVHTYSKEDNKVDKDTRDSAPWVTPLPFSSEEFSKAWQSWIDYRKQMKKPIVLASMEAQWKSFALWGEQKSIIAIELSIANGWQGLFEPARSQGGKGKASKPLTSEDHSSF